jgi:hypothetical protein
VLSGRYELEVATMRVPAEVFLDPPYDPSMSRIRAEARPPGATYATKYARSADSAAG